jgi:cytochrome P450
MAHAPPGLGRIASLLLYRACHRDYLATFVAVSRRFGTVARAYLPNLRVLLSHAADIKQCLLNSQERYRKSDDYKQMAIVLGNGLLTSDGPIWKESRRFLTPQFVSARLERYHANFVTRTAEMLSRWKTSSSPTFVVDASSESSELSLQCVIDALFGCDVITDPSAMKEALDTVLRLLTERAFALFPLPLTLPTFANRHLTARVSYVNGLVAEAIKRRERNQSAADDLLGVMTSSGIDPGLVKDQLVTFLVAGHETTGTALAWVLLTLSRFPDVQEQLADEARSVLGGGVATYQSVAQLPLAKMVVQEVLRLFPIVPTVSRTAAESDEIRGFAIRKGANVTCVVWLAHRDPEFWIAPDVFDPRRFERGGPPN